MTDNEKARDAIARVVPEEFNEEYLRELMQAVKSLTKGLSVEVTCKHCKKSQKTVVQVPDFKQIVDSMTEFFNQAYGRPGTDSPEAQGVVIVVERNWPTANHHANGHGPR